MDRLELGPVVAMRAPRFGYVRIDASGQMTPQQLLAALTAQQMGHFLATSGKPAALLNAGTMLRFGTEDVEHVATRWAPLLPSIGIRKLSLVVPEQVFALFGQVFTHFAGEAAKHGVELRAFPLRQFTDTWESVSWLEPAAPAPAKPPVLVDTDAWNRGNVLGIAFLTPEGAPPGLGFIFQDAAAGRAIFERWRRDLGPRDDAELLRVAIIEGERPGRPPGYVVTIQPDVEALVARATQTGELDIDVNGLGGWAKSMNTPPGGSPHLQTFKQLYAQRGELMLVPVAMTGGSPEPLYDLALVKRKLHLRHVSQITSAQDPDRFVLG